MGAVGTNPPDAAMTAASERATGEAVPPTVRTAPPRRRPTGAPPPLPRQLGTSGKLWIGLAIVLGAGLVWFFPRGQPQLSVEIETWLMRTIADLRADWLTPTMRALGTVGTGWTPTILGGVTVILLVVFKRWRHLLVFLGALAIFGGLLFLLYLVVKRPRPYEIEIIGPWNGFAMPSFPVGVLTACLVGIAYSLVIPGRPRQWAKLAITVVVALVAFARLYLAVDHPSDIAWAVISAVAIMLFAFRWFTPNEAFPVTYRRGKTAHLDVTGARGKAIRQAINDQLGLTVNEVTPIGLAASGGSTPLRLRIAGDPDRYVFAKLYAKSHVRADRWYKIGRTILYGTLEDETSFQNVRRFVQYEDYTLRLMQDMRLPVPASYGIVEITPEREYLIMMEFFEGAVEISEVEVDDGIIDEGLRLIRRLWDAGLAHRDIKPGNLMVRDGRVLLVDAFFVQVRPSPWRQAVDLGNMMLVLAVKSDPERVYQHALHYFTPAELAEAFAATRGVASPTQLRAVVKQDGRDLLAQFRMLAPERRPIGIQRWNLRRIAVALGVFVLFASAVGFAVAPLTPLGDIDVFVTPTCRAQRVTVLMAQAVPSASAIPCVASLPAGLTFAGGTVRNGQATFWLDSDRGGEQAITVTLTSSCDTSGARAVTSDEPAAERLDDPEAAAKGGSGIDRVYRFAGGCVTHDYAFASNSELTAAAEEALSFLPREQLVGYVRAQDDLTLCGAGTTCVG
ncbi:MAG TPA: phosphatase PAP2 family protein [Actinomycetes bacterium]|nr:phosphatase PAP2 family protein [Actinomycetes bacterium]